MKFVGTAYRLATPLSVCKEWQCAHICPVLYNSADRCDDRAMYTNIMLLTFGSVFHEQAFLAQGTQSSDQHTRQTAQ